MPFKMHKIIFFFQKKKSKVPTLPKIFSSVTPNTLIFLFGLRGFSTLEYLSELKTYLVLFL